MTGLRGEPRAVQSHPADLITMLRTAVFVALIATAAAFSAAPMSGLQLRSGKTGMEYAQTFLQSRERSLLRKTV
eukprot:1633330-Rhodomonas_salina.1